MPTETWARRFAMASVRWWPETLLAVLTAAVFLGCLGSVELWGKREQRASAEAIDTVDHGHWLIAQIQGRPRLEKPPLPRWSIATLMLMTGRRDEWVVRLPGAVAGLATVWLIYLLGRRMGGRSVGLASAFVLCSTGFFVGEMRQASNDGLLALFTTLALYAAFQCFHSVEINGDSPSSPAARTQGDRAWSFLFHAALGLGFLTKGPIILLLVGMTIVPYLALGRRLKAGLRVLRDGRGLLIFMALVFFWPAAVLHDDPSALRVWSLEMSEKTGLSRILEHRWHSPLVGEWPGMMLPWTLIAVVAVFLPLRTALFRSPAESNISLRAWFADALKTDPTWFAWWWALGNLVAFSAWVVAKPNYYIPCLPGMALLVGTAWVHLARVGRGTNKEAVAARGILQAQWVLMVVAAAIAPVVFRDWLPAAYWPWTLAIAAVVIGSVILSVRIWRHGGDALPLAPLAAACVVGVLIAYGIIAPIENDQRSHRLLAHKLKQLVPENVGSLKFFNEIDEGLWFYLRGLDLSPVPGTHPRYNSAYDLAHSYLTARHPSESLSALEAKRRARDKQALFDWVDQCDPRTSLVLIRGSLYDTFASDLADRVIPVLRETGLKRNELVLLQVAPRHDQRPAAATVSSAEPLRR